MNIKLIVLLLLISPFAFYINSHTANASVAHNQAWIDDRMANVAGPLLAMNGSDGQPQKPNVEANLLSSLEATACTGRYFAGGDESFEVLILNSDKAASFHNPDGCFSSQDYQIKNENIVTVPTKSRGDVPVSMLELTTPNGRSTYACFTFLTDGKFDASQPHLKRSMFIRNLLTARRQEAFFYRFVSEKPTTEEELVKFVGNYLDADKIQNASAS